MNTNEVYTVIRYAPDDCMVLGIFEDPVDALHRLNNEVDAKRASGGSIPFTAYYHSDLFDLVRVSFSADLHIALRREALTLRVRHEP